MAVGASDRPVVRASIRSAHVECAKVDEQDIEGSLDYDRRAIERRPADVLASAPNLCVPRHVRAVRGAGPQLSAARPIGEEEEALRGAVPHGRARGTHVVAQHQARLPAAAVGTPRPDLLHEPTAVAVARRAVEGQPHEEVRAGGCAVRMCEHALARACEWNHPALSTPAAEGLHEDKLWVVQG